MPQSTPARDATGERSRSALAVCLALAALFATYHAFADILEIALRDEEASHVLLVPAVAGWLLWVRRPQLERITFRESAAGPVLIGLGWVAAWYGYDHAVQALWHAGSITVVVGALVSVLGHDVVRRLAPVFAVFAFLVPVPGMIRQEIAIPLQNATAIVTEALFAVVSVPVERAGNLLRLNGVEVAVAEACNGMRMVFALGLVTYAFAFGTPLSNPVRLLVLALAPVFAIAASTLRLAPTVWLYAYYPESLGPLFHGISGWGMILLAFVAILGVSRLLHSAGVSPAGGT